LTDREIGKRWRSYRFACVWPDLDKIGEHEDEEVGTLVRLLTEATDCLLLQSRLSPVPAGWDRTKWISEVCALIHQDNLRDAGIVLGEEEDDD
jgi:hypothetical protein